jgi:F-type H+-transporting ATPase subunit h
LKDYEAQSPEIEGASTDPTGQAIVEDWFEEEEEEAAAAH